MTAFTSAPLRASSSTHMPPKQNPIAATRTGSTSDLFLTSSYQATARARSRSGSLKTSNHGSAARLGIGVVHAAAVHIGRDGDIAETRQTLSSFAHLFAETVCAVHHHHRRMLASCLRNADLADELNTVMLDWH
jgi:hypothetical protein